MLVLVGTLFIVGCPNALAASTVCEVTDRWFAPHFSVLASFCISLWTALRFASRSGLLVGLTLLIGPPLRLHVLSWTVGIFFGMNLGLYFLM